MKLIKALQENILNESEYYHGELQDPINLFEQLFDELQMLEQSIGDPDFNDIAGQMDPRARTYLNKTIQHLEKASNMFDIVVKYAGPNFKK